MSSVKIDPIKDVFTPARGREIIELVTETTATVEGEATRPFTRLSIMEINHGRWRSGRKLPDANVVRALQRAEAK